MAEFTVLRLLFDNPGGSVGVCSVCGTRYETPAGQPVNYLGKWNGDHFDTTQGGCICGACLDAGPGGASARADRIAADIREKAERFDAMASELADMGETWTGWTEDEGG